MLSSAYLFVPGHRNENQSNLRNSGHFDVERLKVFGLRRLEQSPVRGSELDRLTESNFKLTRRG